MEILVSNEKGEPVKEAMFSKGTLEDKKYNILDIDDIEAGEGFSGIVYCLRTTCNVNKFNNDKYNIGFMCVDKNGKVFNATLFDSADKIQIENRPILIKEGYKTDRFDGRIYYNLTKVAFDNYLLPIGYFIKEIDNLTKIDKEVNEKCEKVLGDTYTKLMEQGIFQSLKTRTIGDFQGTKIGSGLSMLKMIITLLDNMTEIGALKNSEQYKRILISEILLIYRDSIKSYNTFSKSNAKVTEEELNTYTISECINTLSTLLKQGTTDWCWYLSVVLEPKDNMDDKEKQKVKYLYKCTKELLND